MDTISEIRTWLKDRPIADLDVIAERAGVTVHALHKIRQGKTTNPRWATVTALLDQMRDEQRGEAA